MVLIGGLLAGTGYVLLGTTHSYLLFVPVFVIALTPGIQVGFDMPGFVAINRWFTRDQTMAFALASAGFGFGGAIFVPLVALGVDRLGWRAVAIIIGTGIYLFTPAVYIVFRRAEPEDDPGDDIGAGESRSSPSHRAPRTGPPNDRPITGRYTLRAALKSRPYWLLVASFGFRGIVLGMLTVHLVPIMVWKGLEEARAGMLLGAYPLLRIPAQVLVGWQADRWPKPWLAATTSLVGSSGLVLLALYSDANAWQMLAVFALISVNEGWWPLAWSMITEEFGRRNFGALRGVLMSSLSFFSLGAPLYAGWVFDRTESYLWVVWPAVIMLLLSGLLTLLAFPSQRARSAGDGAATD